jgi:mono/diheme cytochrome c family protein
LPPGVTAQQIALGRAISKGGTCVGCHGSDGRGSMASGALTGPTWLWCDGSVEGLARTITIGVSQSNKASGAMPAMARFALSPDEVRAVAGYVWTLKCTG